MRDGESNFAELLHELPESQVREFCIQAVRAVRRIDRNPTLKIDPRTLEHQLVPILRRHRPHLEIKPLAPLERHMDDDWATNVLLFFVWLERNELGVMLGRTPEEPVRRVRLLPAGIAFFDGAGDDHPLVPGWADRIRRRSPNMPDHVVELMIDAHRCYERGLLRPSVALLGVALEGLVDEVHDTLLARPLALQPPNPRGAAQRIAAVRFGVNLRWPLPRDNAAREAVTAAMNALNFADHLRDRRNHAAHPVARFPFDDRGEVEELLLLAARNVAGLWAMA